MAFVYLGGGGGGAPYLWSTTILCDTMKVTPSVIQCYAELYNVMQSYTMLCRVIQCYTELYSVIQSAVHLQYIKHTI